LFTEHQGVENMEIQRIDHVGINVNDLAAAKAFFLDFGFEVQWEGEMDCATFVGQRELF
jgi:catechol 2,3-dioxygenase-like lactoylglutathione lyase family enzyme